MKPEERTKAPQIQDYFVDLGMKKEEVEKCVENLKTHFKPNVYDHEEFGSVHFTEIFTF